MTVLTLDSAAYCYVYSLALSDSQIPAIANTQVHLLTWASPVSAPEFLTATRGHSPTWASLISVPAYRLPTQTSSPFQLRSYYTPISPLLLLILLASRESSRVARSCFYFASWRHHIFLLHPSNLYPVSLGKTSNKGRSTTHCATVACRFSM